MAKAKKEGPDPKVMVLDELVRKAGMKQDVFARTREAFKLLREVLKETAEELAPAIASRDPRLIIEYSEQNDIAAQLKAAGDTVIFTMHTNVFKLDQGNSLWKSSYLEEDELRGYFGLVNIYNFLSDSFRFNRERDLGYLVARLFLNKDGHFFMQGKRQLGFLYNDLADNVLDREQLKKMVLSVLLYVLEFDLLAPPYDQVNQVTVEEMNQLSSHSLVSTGKRLGFRFQAEGEEVN